MYTLLVDMLTSTRSAHEFIVFMASGFWEIEKQRQRQFADHRFRETNGMHKVVNIVKVK